MRSPRPGRPAPLPLLAFGVASLLLHAAGAVVLLPRVEGFHPIAETVAGETLEVDEEPLAAAEEESAQTPPSVAAEDLPAVPAPSAVARARDVARSTTVATSPGSASGASPPPPPLPFGAAGVRYASDLATTFTRSFPQAASGDKAWTGAPFGAAGSAIVSLVIDENGHLMSSAVLGSPSPELRRGIDRTLALLEPRAFTASAAITRLRVTARVARDDVHDGLHGEVFALSGGSFAGDVGAAFFALPGGPGAARRVDVEVRFLP